MSPLVRVALAVAFAAGLALRLAGLADPPLAFHPTRQYAGLQVAKAKYLDLRPDAPPWERAMARANAEAAPDLEPRLLESVVAAGYLALGGERPWLGGALSSVLWLLGGAALFLLARRLASGLAAGVAVAFHLFVPYGIPASRSFQPDPAMVAFMLGALYGMVRHHDDPRLRKVVVPAGLSAVAILIKPVAVFVLVGGFVALAVRRGGFRNGAARRSTVVFLSVAAAPAVVLYGYGLATGGGLESQARMSFIPRLLLDAFYWQGWVRMVNLSVGAALAAVALSATFVARNRDARVLMAGLFLGYASYGLAFNYHVATHDYYQLQLIPIVALGLGLTADAGLRVLRRLEISDAVKAAAAVVVLPLLVMVAQADLAAARPMSGRSAGEFIAQAEEIGEKVSHSTRTVMLAPAYGMPLAYHGNLSGRAWPTVGGGDFRLAELQGRPQPPPDELFREMLDWGAEWFVVTDFGELHRQPGLLSILDEHGRQAARGAGYLVYRLGAHRVG